MGEAAATCCGAQHIDLRYAAGAVQELASCSCTRRLKNCMHACTHTHAHMHTPPPPPPQEKHVETAKKLLGTGPELTAFVSRLMDDIGNLRAMLQAICIGAKGQQHHLQPWLRHYAVVTRSYHIKQCHPTYAASSAAAALNVG